MPTIIIRPFNDWKDTVLSADTVDELRVKFVTFMENIIKVMQKIHNETGILDYMDDFHRINNCMDNYENYTLAPETSDQEEDPLQTSSIQTPSLESNGTSVHFCPVIFDSWNCWRATRVGQIQHQSCPNFPHLGFDPARNASKFCTEYGTWWVHPQSNRTWSNYTKCVDLKDLLFHQSVNTITMSGLVISLLTLLLSLFLFFYFKSLNCGRIKMHKNLFMAMASNNSCWIIWYVCVINNPEVGQNNPVWCRLLHVVTNYFMLSTYTWMLGEGVYLQLLLINTWRVKRWQIWTIIVGCWSLPICSIVPYTWSRLAEPTENANCWMDTTDSIWYLGVLVVLVMVVNLIFVINVIRVIRRKRGHQSENSNVNSSTATTMKAARAALMLVPILGLHFMLLPMRPKDGSALEYVYEVVSSVTSSFQGFMVSLLFCFLNSDVLEAIRKKCLRSFRARYGGNDGGLTGGAFTHGLLGGMGGGGTAGGVGGGAGGGIGGVGGGGGGPGGLVVS
ncbi:calcitonin gene-related peptide type 1 receptor-like [Tigriopus californicus]|uniref:calcitonin gene-related peptide type 1 receptor-like n=1 Tax=Tigriopus californicus TaxID=6832 RepID=UPI0027DA7728|nr:calcitonin gene-related peptide type 1 receptor-like [Tigriopus californicus]